MPGEVGALDQVGRDDPVGAGGDARLREEPLPRLDIARSAGHAVLDRAEGVEHVNQGPPPPSREVEANEPRKPVVAVEKRVLDPPGAAEGVHAVGEGREVLDLGRSGDRTRRARLEVDDPGALAQADDLRDRGVLAAGEHVHLEARPPELPGELAHVDVHAPRFLAAERGQRARVDGQKREPRQVRDDHDRSRVIRRTSVGSAPNPYL